MAGSWIEKNKRLTVSQKTQEVQKPIGYVYEFTADESDASIPVLTIDSISGLILGCDYVEDGVTPADTVTIDIAQIDGISRLSGTFTDSGFLYSMDAAFFPIAGGFKVTITGNTTVSAKGKIVILVSW